MRTYLCSGLIYTDTSLGAIITYKEERKDDKGTKKFHK